MHFTYTQFEIDTRMRIIFSNYRLASVVVHMSDGVTRHLLIKLGVCSLLALL